MVFMTRGIAFANMPDRMIQMWQYDKTWREVFTDGRPLPKNVGGAEKDAPDPHYWGYSVGHWQDDYTFIVETTADRSMLVNASAAAGIVYELLPLAALGAAQGQPHGMPEAFAPANPLLAGNPAFIVLAALQGMRN